MIDKAKVKNFWDRRAEALGRVAFESIANLEEDPRNLELKIAHETRKVFSWLGDVAGKSVLDLGAGVGQWSFRFEERGARRVVAVEYSAQLAEIGRSEAARRGGTAVRFETAAAESFVSEERFDIVFISGLFVYLTDEQAEAVVRNLRGLRAQNGVVMLRDGVGVAGRYEIDDRYSEHLGSLYSATYRTREQYLELMSRVGLSLCREENMFEEGHPLNKYPETRLRLFLFGGQD